MKKINYAQRTSNNSVMQYAYKKGTICAGKFKQQYVALGCQFPNCEIHSENI